LLNCHGERLYRLLVRLTLREDVAEDLLQDLVVKLAQASTFAAAENPYAYARKAAVNLAFSWIRSRRRGREHVVESIDPPADDPPPWSRLVRSEDIRRVLDHMEDLGERDRLILAMRYFDDAGFEEIAQVIGGTGHQARGLCHKAIRQLRTAMVETDGIEPDRGTLQPRTEVKP
jgi:RNA polymerase sigma factor (sigma-70 family)